MKFSYNWLKELSGTEKSPEALAALFTTRSFEVEEFREYEHGLDGVVVGEVLSAEPHPDADRLKVTRVSFGSTDEVRTIVCGAPNVAAGQKVAVALPGTVLPNGATISESVIRGVTSSGMICAEDELGMGTNHEGILVLPPDTPIGVPVVEVFGLDDTIFDIKILPNRGTDALSHYGLAREIAALEGRSFPSADIFEKPFSAQSGPMSIRIDDASVCGAYTGLSFSIPEGTIPFTPLPLAGKLLVLGNRPIHPAADIANYLCLLFGQPMHAFDADKLSGSEISVRFAKEGEKILLLDDKEIELSVEDVVIADASGPVALAGIMGGKESAVSPSTKNVFFEVASFDPKTIRKSRIRHGLSTDAAYYFEHAVDISWVAKLRGEIVSRFETILSANNTGVSGMIPEPLTPYEFGFPITRIEGLLGVSIPDESVVAILEGLSIGARIEGGVLSVSVPSFRPDIRNEADIIEEIGRIYGYENVSSEAPLFPLVPSEKNHGKSFERKCKQLLSGNGWDEIQTYSFYGASSCRLSGNDSKNHFLLENPMNPDQSYLRTTLLPNILEKAIENMSRTESLRIFEFGSTYAHDGNRVTEKKKIACAFGGRETSSGDAFFSLKGEIERFFSALRIGGTIDFSPNDHPSPIFHPGRTATMTISGEEVGIIGAVHPSFVKKLGSRDIVVAEIAVDVLRAHESDGITLAPLPKFPFVLRDLSLSVPDSVPVAKLESVVRSAAGPMLKSMSVFDVYQKDGQKNVAFHLAFGLEDRTLSKEEGEEIFQRIVSRSGEEFGAKLPG